MNAHDQFATDTVRAAIKAALAGLNTAYTAVTDCRLEDTIVSLIDDLNEYLGDIDNLVDQIEAERPTWNRPYAAV